MAPFNRSYTTFYWSAIVSMLYIFELLHTTKEEVNAFARVCLSVCEQDYTKMRAWIWMKCCVLTDVGTWTN